MNIVASRSGSEEGRECRQNITPTKTHRNWEQGRSVPVHLEDTKSTGSLHSTSSKYWQYSTSITQSDSQLKLTLSFNRENCPSTWFRAQMKNTIPTLPHTTHTQWAAPLSLTEGEKTLRFLEVLLERQPLPENQEEQMAVAPSPSPIRTLLLSAVQSKYDASRTSHFKLPSGHTNKVKQNKTKKQTRLFLF